MKKLYTLSLLFAGLLSFGQAQDAFMGSGALTDAGWAHHSGATTGQLTTGAGSIAFPGFTTAGNKVTLVAGNSEDVNLASATALTGTVYYSAILNLADAAGLAANTATGDYFLMTSATAGTGVSPSPPVTSFSARIYIKAGVNAGTYTLGVLNNSGGTAAPTYTGTDYDVNVPLFVVVKYDMGTNTASLFINPALGGTEVTPAATNATGTTAAPAQIAAIAIRQGGTATAGTGNVQIDELRLNTTWAAVTTNVLGTTNQTAIAGLKVYPNPVTNGNLYITSDNSEVKQVVIYDVLGKQVIKTTVSEQPVNVSALNSGVYMVKITEAGKTATRKLVIR